MTESDFRDYLRARDITCTSAYPDGRRFGEKSEIIGLNLAGPRGAKHFAARNPDGTYDAFSTKLWWDSVEYASQRLRESRATENRRRGGIHKRAEGL